MGLLGAIGKAAGSLLGGDTIKDIGKIVDDLHTSGEEKEEAKPVSTKRPKTHSSVSIPTSMRQSQEEYIDLTNDDESPSLSLGNKEWICSRCTLRNKALALVCDACLEERKF